MPCRYFLPGEEEAIQRKELDRVTRLLCEVMTELEAEGALDRPGICLSNEVMQWWREHQIRDKKRKEEVTIVVTALREFFDRKRKGRK